MLPAGVGCIVLAEEIPDFNAPQPDSKGVSLLHIFVIGSYP
jgi:hypothetical protein